MRYVPIPPVEIDPRNDREILEQALQEVRAKSNGLLSDLSESDPIRAIVEGQVFAYGEFLSYFNQIPEALLIEWIAPFLGAQRRAGSSSLVEVTLTLGSPAETDIAVGRDFTVTTNPNQNNGVTKSYRPLEPILIPSGASDVTAQFKCTTRGVAGNCLPGSVSIFQPLAGISSVTNLGSGFGGSDIETIREAKERFLSLIRRRVPISVDDWIGTFQDLLGVGSVCFPEPSRTGSFIFKVLKPGFSPLSPIEVESSLDVIKNLVPIGYEVDIQPIPVRDIKTEVSLSYSNLGVSPKALADLVRNKLLEAIRFLPKYSSLSSSDLSAWVSSNLGVGETFLNPKITKLECFANPTGLDPKNFRGTLKQFNPSFLLETGDLVEEFPVTEPFNPTVYDKDYYSTEGFIRLEIVKDYVLGASYRLGEVLADGALYRMVLKPFTASGGYINDISSGNISGTLTLKEWTEGFLYRRNDVIVSGSEVTAYVPSSRIVWVVVNQFTSQNSTNELSSAQSQGLVNTNPVVVQNFSPGRVYSQGEYIKTPDPSEFLDYPPSQFFVSPTLGVVQKYYRVEVDFTSDVEISDLSGTLVSYELEGLLREVKRVESLEPFRYRARHKLGTSVYTGNNVYLVAKEFTPFTQNVDQLVASGYLKQTSYLTPMESTPLFELSEGDITFLRKGNQRLFYRVKQDFTPVYNPEVYLSYLEPTNRQSDVKSFNDFNRTVEDTALFNNLYYKVVRPFSPENNSVEELESLGYLQRVEVKMEEIQSSFKDIALMGQSFISINESSTFFFTREENFIPLYRGVSLF